MAHAGDGVVPDPEYLRARGIAKLDPDTDKDFLEPLREAYRSAGADEAADAGPLWQVARHSLLPDVLTVASAGIAIVVMAAAAAVAAPVAVVVAWAAPTSIL